MDLDLICKNRRNKMLGNIEWSAEQEAGGKIE